MGQKHGYGVFVWGDGGIYKGHFDNNNIDGEGTYR